MELLTGVGDAGDGSGAQATVSQLSSRFEELHTTGNRSLRIGFAGGSPRFPGKQPSVFGRTAAATATAAASRSAAVATVVAGSVASAANAAVAEVKAASHELRSTVTSHQPPASFRLLEQEKETAATGGVNHADSSYRVLIEEDESHPQKPDIWAVVRSTVLSCCLFFAFVGSALAMHDMPADPRFYEYTMRASPWLGALVISAFTVMWVLAEGPCKVRSPPRCRCHNAPQSLTPLACALYFVLRRARSQSPDLLSGLARCSCCLSLSLLYSIIALYPTATKRPLGIYESTGRCQSSQAWGSRTGRKQARRSKTSSSKEMRRSKTLSSKEAKRSKVSSSKG